MMLNKYYCFQKHAMEYSVEIVIEKLLHVTKDTVPKVTDFIDFFLFNFGCSLYLDSASLIFYSGLK